MDSRKDVPFAEFCSQNRYFYALVSRPLKGKITNFRLIWPLTLEVQRENTPYSSSEPNESDIVIRQSRGDKLKYSVSQKIPPEGS